MNNFMLFAYESPALTIAGGVLFGAAVWLLVIAARASIGGVAKRSDKAGLNELVQPIHIETEYKKAMLCNQGKLFMQLLVMIRRKHGHNNVTFSHLVWIRNTIGTGKNFHEIREDSIP